MRREVDLAAEVPCRGADEDANGDRDRGGPDPDDERDPGAVDDAAEDVPPDVIVAEPMVCRGSGAAQFGVDRIGIVGGDQRCKDRQDHEEADKAQAEDGRLVALEPSPGLRPGIAVRIAGGERSAIVCERGEG
jgi:hypothetical protein